MILVDTFKQLYDGTKNKTFIYNIHIDNFINFNLETFSLSKKMDSVKQSEMEIFLFLFRRKYKL